MKYHASAICDNNGAATGSATASGVQVHGASGVTDVCPSALSMLRFAPPLLLACASAQPISILVSGGVLSETESRFASWNIDPSCNRGFHSINFSNPNLVAAAAALSPSRLRFGGSGADDLLYSFTSDGVCDGLPPPGSPGDCHYVTSGCLNASHFSSLLGLLTSNAAGPAFENQFIFGLSFNISEASAGLPWNAANAERLLTHLQWPSDAVWGFELGNEVNNAGTVKPEQQAAAVLTLSRMLGPTGRVRYPPPVHIPRRTPTPALDHPSRRAPLPPQQIVGPDSGYREAQAWDTAFLPLVKAGGVSLHAVTHHVYLSLTPHDFTTSTEALANKLDSPLAEIAWYTQLAQSQAPGSQVWVSSTPVAARQKPAPAKARSQTSPPTRNATEIRPTNRLGRTAPLAGATTARVAQPPFAESMGQRFGTRTTWASAASTGLCSTIGRTSLAARTLTFASACGARKRLRDPPF